MPPRTLAPIALLAALLTLAPLPAAAESLLLTIRPPDSSISLPATLLTPDGPGPFPAVVVMHDCSGLGPRSSGSPRRWAGLLVGAGYAVLLPDSFAPRGLPNGLCHAQATNRAAASVRVRAGDAHAALAALRRQPSIDPHRIALIGGSHGGSTTLAAMVAAEASADGSPAGFAAAVALYPSCGIRYGGWSIRRADGATGAMVAHAGTYRPAAPVLILAGGRDDWTPADQCVALAAAARRDGQPVELVVYPDAHHAFDSAAPERFVATRRNVNATSGLGATTGGNAAAWADSRRRVLEFLAARLGPRN